MTAQQPELCDTCKKDRTVNCPARQFNKFLVQFTGCLYHSSRPHPPAPELPIETCHICDIARPCDDIFGAIGYPPCVQRAARAATLATLDKIDAIAKEGMKKKEDGLGKKYCMEHPKAVDSCHHALHRLIESLRQSTRQEPHP